MASVGGDILEVRFTHPTLGSGVFYPKANEGNTMDAGGFRASDDASMISGDGQMIDTINRVRSSFEILLANDQNGRNDAIVAGELSASPVLADWTISMINGTVWGMTGKPVGDIQPDTNAATFTLKIAGSVATKIVG